MPAMRTVGTGHQLSPHVHVRRDADEYVIELDVSDFTELELSIEAVGPCITVRGDQLEGPEDDGKPFRLHERLEESFRLPDDADPDRVKAFYKHRAPRSMHRASASSRTECRSSARPCTSSTPVRNPAESFYC